MSISHGADGTNSADGQTAVVTDGDTQKPQQVSYSTYDKAMSSLAKEKQARIELEKQLNEIKEKEMIQQGKYKELLEQKESELKEVREKSIKDKALRIESSVNAKITEVALKRGAHDPADVLKNISLKELGVDVDGNFDINVLEQKVDEIKTKKSYLFKQSAAKIADGVPKIRTEEKSGGNSIDDLKRRYIEAALKK